MEDFLEGLNEAASDAVPETDAASFQELLRELGDTTNMNGEDMSWIESLFHRILAPISDVFNRTEGGIDTERLRPGENGDEIAEGVEGHHISDATEEWHVQEGDNSCAVCSQQFIINEFTDLNLTEEQLCDIAEAQGWFDPETGTAPADVGNLLQLFGIDTQVSYEGDINGIKNTLDQGGRVIVAVDSMVFWVDGFGNYPVYGADHAIEVIGIDDSDPLDVRVIVNDSGIDGGGGRSVPYLEFMEAWFPSGGFMVSAFPKD